jgi:Fic family protein
MERELPEPLLAFTHDDSLVDELARVDSLASRYRDEKSHGRILENSLEAIRVELTYHSNAIEGSTLTLRDTHLVIEGLEPNTGKSLREIYEARNHDRALREVESWTRNNRGILTEQDIRVLHGIVMHDIDRSGAGVFRTGRVLISGSRFVPPGSHHFPVLIPKMLELAQQPTLHPLIRAAELHYNFVAIHPFVDGNGRTSRLLMNYHLLQAGYYLAVIPVERRGEYIEALELANTGNPLPFSAFIISCLTNTLIHLLGDN